MVDQTKSDNGRNGFIKEAAGRIEDAKKGVFDCLHPICRRLIKNALINSYQGKRSWWKDMESEALLQLWVLVRDHKINLARTPEEIVAFLDRSFRNVFNGYEPGPVDSVSFDEERNGVEGKEDREISYIRQDIFDRVFCDLSDRNKTVVVLKFHSGYTQKKIAEIFGVSQPWISKIIEGFKDSVRKLEGDRKAEGCQ